MNAIDKPAIPARLLSLYDDILRASDKIEGPWPVTARQLRDHASHLREIAAELQRPAPEPQTAPTAILATFAEARCQQDLARSWRDAAPTLRQCTTADRLTAVEAWITRLCVVSEDDGR